MSYGRIYFSTDREYMFEKRMNHEMILFKRELSENFAVSKTVKWVPLKRLINHQIDISELCFYNYLYSPNLQFYFDSDS